MLARRLGYRCIDRDVIVERAAAHAVSQSEIREALEKPPSFLDRFRHKRYLYLALVQAALAEEVRTGRAVYHGLAGHMLLKGGPILRTRIIAPMEFRIRMLMERLKYSHKDAAAYIEKVDDDRRKWTQFLYGVDWGDPSLYDMVLNLEFMSIDEACGIIAAAAVGKCFEFTPECQQKMDDLALAGRIRADLALNRSTSDLELEVVARLGAVSIRGRVGAIDQIAEIKQVALATPGATSVDLEEVGPPAGLAAV